MKALSKAAILGADDLPRETVEVPEWGGAVVVRSMTAAERDAFEAEILEKQDRPAAERLANLRARVVARTAVDANGVRLFADEDIEALGQKSARALDRVYAAASKLNGLSERDEEELAKN
jgi:hypothetical protein